MLLALLQTANFCKITPDFYSALEVLMTMHKNASKCMYYTLFFNMSATYVFWNCRQVVVHRTHKTIFLQIQTSIIQITARSTDHSTNKSTKTHLHNIISPTWIKRCTVTTAETKLHVHFHQSASTSNGLVSELQHA